MNWETLKHIYKAVLIDQWKIQYHGDDKYAFIRYYFDGKPQWKMECKNGKYHGLYQRWWADGQLQWKEVWENGKRIK